MARKERKYHYIYKITCLKNNRYYIGMHSTDNLDDGYFGGGKIIKSSVKKYGKEKHRKEILEFFESRELLEEREIYLVNEELIKDTLCMNINLGCDGGWLKEWSSKGAKAANEKNWKNQDFRDMMKNVSSNNLKKLWNDPESNIMMRNIAANAFKDKKHTEETKKAIGEKNSKNIGDVNSQFGTCWILNESIRENKKIKKEDLEYFIKNGWKLGRCMKF